MNETQQRARYVCAAVALALIGCGDADVLALEPRGPRCGDAGPTAIRARAADDLANFLGVGLRLGYTDTPYAERELVSNALIELGIRHVAEIAADAAAIEELGQTAVSALLLDATPDALSTLPTGAARMVQLVQPPSPRLPQDASEADWSSALDASLNALRSSLDDRSELTTARIVAPALPRGTLAGVEATLAARTDLSLMTGWPGNVHPGDVTLERQFAEQEALSPGRQRIATQIGYSTSAAAAPDEAVPSEVVHGKYTTRLVLNLFRRGWQRLYLAQLFDWHADDQGFDDRGGLLDSQSRRKPAFTVLRNLLEVLSDAGPPHAVGALEFQLAGDTANVRNVLLQNRAQRFLLVMWLEIPSSDDVAEQPVVLSLGTAVDSITLYRPETSSYAAQRYTSSELEVSVSDWPTVLEIATPCR